MLRLAQGRVPEAEATLRQVQQGLRVAIGDDQRETLFWTLRIGAVLREQGRLSEAEPYLRRALEGLHRSLGDEHRDTLFAILEMGLLRRDEGKLAEAESYLRQALDGCRRVARHTDGDYLAMLGALGSLLESQQKYSEAEPLYAELYENAARAQIGAARAARHMSHYGPCLVRLARYEQAEPPLREAYKRLKQTEQYNHERMRVVVEALGELCEKTNRPDEASGWRAVQRVWRDPLAP
jgi:tetratricopeptide (TPR) repeat protein